MANQPESKRRSEEPFARQGRFRRPGRPGGTGGLPGLALVALSVVALTGCGLPSAGRFADGLSGAVLDQEDPGLVQDGLPAYLILLDALIRSEPKNPQYLAAAAKLNAVYGLAFSPGDPRRGQVLTAKARGYGARSLCAADDHACSLDALDFEAYAAVIDEIDRDEAEYLYGYCVGSLAYIRAHSDDWSAIANLPKVEYALKHLLAMKNPQNAASINMYLGILNTLRPEALGGRPEQGREYFETAIMLSGGRDLAAKVEFARGYARLVYDRQLHDQLLTQVLAASPQQEGLTLFNVLAQEQARDLLAAADDYF